MTVKLLYEKVNLIVPLEQRRFFRALNDTVSEIEAKYSDFLFEEGKRYVPINSLEDDWIVLPLYSDAIVDNILFLSGQGEMYKSEFIRKMKNAYLNYWNKNAKKRRLKRSWW